MIMKIYSYLKKLIPDRYKSYLKKMIKNLRSNQETSQSYANIAYSQEGEDRILYSLFGLLNKNNGFYVDVGAHHPLRYSNTHLLYLRGWHGINIDANNDAIQLFQKTRPRDINVAIGVDDKTDKLTFFVFNEPAVNTFDAEVAQNIINNSFFKLIEERIVEVMPLAQVLDIYIAKGQRIDLLSVDVEGRDLAVLKSNDWSRYIPTYVLVEYHSGFDQKEGFSFDEVLKSAINQFLESKGYEAFAKTLNTVFFKFKNPIDTALKVYSYHLSSEFQSRSDELPLPSETYYGISDLFKNSIGTTDPAQADFFFVPLNLIQSQFRNEDPRSIIKELKYLTDKKDHILVAAGDFSQRSKKNHYGHAYLNTYDWLDKFILLALESTSDLIPGQDIGIIPYNTLSDNPYFNTNKRIFMYSFLGQIKHILLPGNHVRSQLAFLENRSDVLITEKLDVYTKKKLLENYPDIVKDDFELLARNSTFTVAPAGYGKWTYRFFNAIQWGSIPVLISDDYIKPFNSSIPYESFSIVLLEKDILNIDHILRSISAREVERYQENLKANQSKFTRRVFFELLVRELESIRH
jgi:FkbM family methyltransferase